MKIKITLSYDGTLFYGSQIQPDQITIHASLLQALKILHIETILDFSGRTDKGVHAFKQVVSCSVPPFWKNLTKLQTALNKLLPNTILIRNIQKVDGAFHARFSAKKREYRYLFTDRKLTPFNTNYLSYYPNINTEKILQALQLFKGVHDFEFFSKKGSDPLSTLREIYDIRLYTHNHIYILNFKANSYLRSQIRMIVDFVMKISEGKLTLDDLRKQLKREKLISWTLAPANGLYLSKITY